MHRDLLLQSLKDAHALEESHINALAQILSFHIERNADFGVSPEARDEIRSILTTIKTDSERHKKLVHETEELIRGKDADDF